MRPTELLIVLPAVVPVLVILYVFVRYCIEGETAGVL